MKFRFASTLGVALFVSGLLLAGCDANGEPEGELLIEDLQEGDGPAVKAGDPIMVSYVGRLEDGTVFDTSEDDELPLAFTLGVGQVIEGWDQGIAGMRPGGTRRLTIPPHLAFGRRGFGDAVPGNATVIFDITLDRILDDVYIEDRVDGEGATAKTGKILTVNYTGTLLGDIEFDSAEGFTFELGSTGFIEGWHRGLEGMRAGGKRMIVIPYHLAYGQAGNGIIPPFSVLTFVVELLEVREP